MAEEIDLVLAAKISAALGVEFRRSAVLFLPLDQLGFGFPSVLRTNGQLGLDAILRACNHPLWPFRQIAHITSLNWGYCSNDCVNPFHTLRDGQESVKELRQTPAQRHSASLLVLQQERWANGPRLVPQSWEAARDYAALEELRVVSTRKATMLSNMRTICVANAAVHDQLRFGFPSVFRINGEIVINAILRMCNHSLLPIKQLAQLTWLNRSCCANDCLNPFSPLRDEQESVEEPRRSPAQRLSANRSPHSEKASLGWCLCRGRPRDVTQRCGLSWYSEVRTGDQHSHHLRQRSQAGRQE